MAKQTFFNLAQAKQTKILNAAMNEIIDKGYDLASIQNIITDAQIPRGSFYQYFKDKDDLAFEILCRSARKKLTTMRPAFKDWQKSDLFGFLRRLIKYGFIFGRENPSEIAVFSALVSSKTLKLDAMAEKFNQRQDETPPLDIDTNELNMKDLKGIYRHLIETGVKDGSIKPSIPVESTVLFIETMFSTLGTKVFITSPDPLSKETQQIYYDFLEILEKGISND